MAEAVAEEYRSSLVDLNFNSKPHINMLTIIAEENVKFAPMIVDTILTHVKSVPPDLKLPTLYLVDSIMKNIGGQYITLFSKHMITLFSSVFEKVEETTRSALYKLRQTWNDILPKNILYGVDIKVNSIDPAWPITAVVAAPVSNAAAASPPSAAASPPPPSAAASSMNQIHINPRFMGRNSTQNPNAAKSQEKPAAIAKTEPLLKDKDTEVMEMKKKQEEMLKLIEEKKTQLKALEQKKLEMAAKQKKSTVLAAPAPVKAPQVLSQKKFVNHRDPRLKKSTTFAQTQPHIKGPEKAGAVSLQSVVVVPNSKLPSDAVNGSVPSASTTKTKEEKPNALTNNMSHADEQSTPRKGAKIGDKSSKGSPKDKNISPKQTTNKNCKNSKKHSTSPENKLGVNAKRFCKLPAGKPKRTFFQESDFQHNKNEPHPTKKQKHEPSKSKNKVKAGMQNSEERVLEYNLFGIEDKDYRHQVRSEDRLQSKHGSQSQTKHVHTKNARVPLENFNAKDHNSTVPPVSTTERNPQKTILPESIAEQNPNVKQTFVETYRPEMDQKIKQEPRIMEGNAIKVENFDRSYTSMPVVAQGRIHPPPTSSIMLDGKNRIIHFVNERAVTIMDNNEPREVNFAGPPRNVYIEGLPHPLQLEFGGRQVEFILDGKRNVVRFGAPSREIYINNFPYEAKFGGPHFTVFLEDQHEHKVRIDGPPPQVMISENPAYDLFEHFNLIKIKKEPEDASMLQDVDMRLKPSHIIQSSLLPECKKDVDWRHVASSSDSTQIPWNVPQNSFETYNDVPGARSFAPGVPTPMDYPNNSNPMTVQSEQFFPDRNSTMNPATWPHPAYREGAPNNERHMDQTSQHIPPNTTWDMKTPTTLPPPPSIPLSLNLSTQSANLSLTNRSGSQMPSLQSMSQLPNMNVPPPSWNPLPPPPMFTGAVPDNLSRQAMAQNPVPESEPVVSSPINVNTIYQKLIAAGIIPKKTEVPRVSATETATKDEKTAEEEKEEEEEIEIPDIRLTPKCLRQFNSAVIALLYKGSQCATCGMRFKEIQSQQYSRHLDWHFRMNRREKDGAKKAYSRRLYYEIKDWIQFKEIEEAEERMPSYFELQTDGETSKSDEKEKIQSVPSSECESEKCSVCGEQFQLFWVEEEEEWHLKHAVRHDGEAYHPMCYEDHKKAIETANREPEDNLADSIKEEPEEPMVVDNATVKAIKEITQENIKKEIKEEDIKKEKEDGPNDDQAVPEATEGEEKPEIPAPESPKDKVSDENAGAAKEATKDPIEEEKETTEMEVDQVEASATESEEADKIVEEDNSVQEDNTAKVVEEDNTDKVVEEDNTAKVVDEDNTAKVVEAELSAKVSVPENAKLNSEAESGGSAEEEFRPPTPDPRFEVLAPVFKGTELSALCTIM